MCQSIIVLPCVRGQLTMHYGSQCNYQRFIGFQFKNKSDDIHTVLSVKYEPDKIYSIVDGVAGTCWLVSVIDQLTNNQITYSIRNWVDIVEYYKTTHSMDFIM